MASLLIVDDEPDLVSVLAMLLSIEGHQITTAADGAHALELLPQLDGSLQLVITDLRMPRLDGLELCRRLRADEATRSIPIILQTANRQQPDGQGVLFDRFLVKPVSIDTLLEEIRALTGSAPEPER